MRLFLSALASLALLGCHARARQTPTALTLSAAELRDALRPGGRVVTYRGDGSPRGDSLARIASSGASELEGGDLALGDRLLRYALWYGFPPDSVARGDFLELMNVTREPAAWLPVIDTVL